MEKYLACFRKKSCGEVLRHAEHDKDTTISWATATIERDAMGENYLQGNPRLLWLRRCACGVIILQCSTCCASFDMSCTRHPSIASVLV